MTTDNLARHIRAGARANARSLLGLLDGHELDLSEEVEVEERLERLETQVKREQLAPVISRVAEPDMYSEHSPHSFVRDLVDSRGVAFFPGSDPGGSLERLLRHQRAVDAHPRSTGGLDRAGVTIERRADSITAGHGGEFVPPSWLLELFASVARGAAPLRGLARRLPLPDDTAKVSIPRWTVAAGVAVQSVENTNPQIAQATTDSISADVVTIAGLLPLSLQLYERGPNFDELVLHDMSESYAAVLETQLVNGTGATGQHLGILNVPTIVSQSYTSATPTPAGVVDAVAKVAGTVADTRKRPPNVLLLRGSRYFYLAGSEQGTTSEPIMRPGTGDVPTSMTADLGPYGPIAGLATFLDDAVPADLGTTTNQDSAIVVRADDLILLEDVPKMSAVIDGPSASSLTVDLVWHCYSAFLPGRYPSGIGTVTGTGFVVPSGF
ncbi:MAG TPA: phage major capsid protein [Mycobacteriales bacterium]|nr:phage major capsid protein [Mycobacteriales bacterium]